MNTLTFHARLAVALILTLSFNTGCTTFSKESGCCRTGAVKNTNTGESTDLSNFGGKIPEATDRQSTRNDRSMRNEKFRRKYRETLQNKYTEEDRLRLKKKR